MNISLLPLVKLTDTTTVKPFECSDEDLNSFLCNDFNKTTII